MPECSYTAIRVPFELAREYVKLGATISIGGPLTFKNARKNCRGTRGNTASVYNE